MSLVAYVVLMVAVLGMVGFGVGVVKFAIWLAVLVAGVVLILRRASRGVEDEQAEE